MSLVLATTLPSTTKPVQCGTKWWRTDYFLSVKESVSANRGSAILSIYHQAKREVLKSQPGIPLDNILSIEMML